MISHASTAEGSRALALTGAERIVQFGISTTPICGVRDNARVLETAFAEIGIAAPSVWCALAGIRPNAARRRAVHQWLALVRSETERTRTDALLLHYSAFAFGPRGLPLFAPWVARQLASMGVPVVGLFHELAYPYRQRGWRGAVQATTQRMALVPVVRRCAAAVVTTEQRCEWLRTQWWLPRRPVEFVPVPSNLPPANEEVVDRGQLVIGIIGFASPGAAVALVAEAV